MKNSIDPEIVGSRIRDIRKTMGLSMSAFAERINHILNEKKIRSGTVSNWETGKNLPNNERLKAIAEIGGISVNELMYGSIQEMIRSVYKELKEGSYIFDISPYENNKRFDMLYNLDNPADSPIFKISKEEEEKVFQAVERFVINGIHADYHYDKDLIAADLLVVLTKNYREWNRSNQNNIKIALRELVNLKEQIMRKYFIDLYELSESGTGFGLVLQKGVNENLYHEMNGIFNEAINKLTELQNKYPD